MERAVPRSSSKPYGYRWLRLLRPQDDPII